MATVNQLTSGALVGIQDAEYWSGRMLQQQTNAAQHQALASYLGQFNMAQGAYPLQGGYNPKLVYSGGGTVTTAGPKVEDEIGWLKRRVAEVSWQC
jgi:hypothetical protein